MHCNHCGARKLKKRRSGPMAGLFVCRCGRAAGPRPLLEAMQWGVPLWVRNLVNGQMVDEGPATTPAIAARQRATQLGLIAVFRALATGVRALADADVEVGEEATCEN